MSRVAGSKYFAGDSIIITKKDGGKKTETVGAVVWKSDDGEKCIVTLKPRGSCRECRGPMVDAPHHRAMGGLCGECAFDEYDM